MPLIEYRLIGVCLLAKVDICLDEIMKKNIFGTVDYEARFVAYENMISTYTSKTVKDIKRVTTIFALLGLRGRSLLMLSSDMQLRREAGRALSKIINSFRADKPSARIMFVTLIDDSGNTSDRVPLFDLAALKAKGYRTLKQLRLHGILIAECHPIINYPAGGIGRTLSWHLHGIVWTYEKELDLKELAKSLARTGSWKCSLGAAPTSIQHIADDDEDRERVAHYLFKPPHSAKNLMPSKQKPGRMLLMDTVAGYRKELAFRMLEGHSQLELMNLIGAVGEGARVRQQLRSSLTEWHRARPITGKIIPGGRDIWRFWFVLRAKLGSRLYMPYRFEGGGMKLRDVKLPAKKRQRLRRPKTRFGRRLGVGSPITSRNRVC